MVIELQTLPNKQTKRINQLWNCSTAQIRVAQYRLPALIALIFCFLSAQVHAQTFAPTRVTTWQNAGLTTELEAPSNLIVITDFGADNTGTTPSNTAYIDAVASLNGAAATIYFPEGEYLFTSSISIPDSVFLKGESATTKLRFNLGGNADLIRIAGTLNPTKHSFFRSGVKGTYQIELEDASEFTAGDIIRLYQYDEDYMFSSWAYGTLGQVIEVQSVADNILTLSDPLTHSYPLSREPFVKKLNAKRAAGIECLKIVREDATPGQTDNIHFNYAFNCAIRNVELENSNFAHIGINSSAHIQIEGCYMHHAHAYGGGGQGYGVVTQTATSFCLTQNNIFNHLRHSMLIQSGANGNVFGYNYSYDPFWEGTSLPANSAGDAVLHGNYTYMNLFEGNTIQNIVVDASHGSNGPYNTFFRNRAELYGFFSDNNTTTDSMNVVGNVITNSGFPLGLFVLSGAGHYSYGNNHSGTVKPTNTSNLTTQSLYLNENELPPFLAQHTLPMVGYPLAMNQKLLPAEERFMAQDYVNCSELVTNVSAIQQKPTDAFALNGNMIYTAENVLPARINMYTLNGALVHTQTLTSTQETLSFPSANNMLLIRAISLNGTDYATFKHVVVN